MKSLPMQPDTRLVQLHAERGNPYTRLSGALAALENASWGMLFSGEVSLACQLAELIGVGTLRVDGRLCINPRAFAEAGLALAEIHGDFSGARGVLAMEPSQSLIERAKRAGVPVIVDATLTPGGDWISFGASYVVYRDSITISGHSDTSLAAIFGSGAVPKAIAAPPSDLSISLVIRDVATLPLRLARAARTASNLETRLGGLARLVSPTALLLPPDVMKDTASPLGGVISSARHVPDGIILTPGLENTDQIMGLLGRLESEGEAEAAISPVQDSPQRQDREIRRPVAIKNYRQERPQAKHQPSHLSRSQVSSAAAAPDKPLPDMPSAPEKPERFVFESSESWKPEIVLSTQIAPQPALTHTVSNGPDAPDQRDGLPDIRRQEGIEPEKNPETEADAPVVPEPISIAPDMPSTTKNKTDVTLDLTTEQANIFSRLRDWRNQEAKNQKISIFMVSSNDSLASMARNMPSNLEELAAIKGMGPARLARYGKKILELIKG